MPRQRIQIFWPAVPEARERGQALRHLLELPNSHPLRSRKLRNLYEHYDEQLHEWLETESAGIYAGPMWLPGRPASMTIGDDTVPWPSIFRVYDPQTHTLSIGSTVYPLPEIVQALERLLNSLIEHRLPSPFTDDA